MQKHYYVIAWALATLMVTAACDNDDDDNTTANSSPVTSGQLEFPALKGGASIVVSHYAELRSGINGVNYSIEWDTEKHAQRWSCYKYYSSISGSSVQRYYTTNKSLDSSGQYPNDPDLPAEYRFTNDPYWGSGYDHGHICPSADRLCSKDANYQTFFLTNMQPQGNDFNAGIWQEMETTVRKTWGSKYDTLYICKGGTIDSADNIIKYLGSGQNKIPVPRYFFMAVLGRYKNTFRATGFWINQEAYYSQTPKTYAITIGELEKKTGIDFFCNLPDDIESQVENVSKAQMLSDWY